jgi:hypothetical protein
MAAFTNFASARACDQICELRNVLPVDVDAVVWRRRVSGLSL